MQQASVLLVVVLGAYCLAGREGEVELGSQGGSCSQHCDGTYPEHTYPDPEDHSACARGCRLAVMDALIAWPFPPDPLSCLATCEEAYGTTSHAYACQTGCNVSTIDQRVPNRDHIYPAETGLNASEMGLVLGFVQAVIDQLPQMAGFGGEAGQLTQHAETMYQLLPGESVTTFVFIEGRGGSLEVEYTSFDDSPGATYEVLEPLSEEEGEEGGEEGLYRSQTSTYRLSCPWKYTAAGRLLSLVGVGLIMAAVLSCCCAGLLSDEAGEKGAKREVSVRLRGDLPKPATFSPGYPQPLPCYSEKKSTHF